MCTVTDDFKIFMQKGIRGGFAPPIPKARYIIVRTAKSDDFTVSTEIRPHGTPSLGPPKIRELKVADYLEALARLQDLLRDLPPQYPGTDDIYGRDIGIVQMTDPASFVDLHHQLGSVAACGMPVPSPTDEQKARFDEAVVIIEKLGA